VPLQKVRPESQLALQLGPTGSQIPTPDGKKHELPQAPQLPAEKRSAHSPEQSASGKSQEATHVPLAHLEHEMSHAPQVTGRFKFASHPSARAWLQSARPVRHLAMAQ
jgi:hypothetical protein